MDITKITGSTAGSYISEAAAKAAGTEEDSFAKRLEAAAAGKDETELKKACQEFESIMLGMMYKSMKATVMKSNLIEEDAGTEMFQSMQDDDLMEQASNTGSFGLAEALYRQLAAGTGAGSVKTAASENSVANEAQKNSMEAEEIGK